MLKSRHLKPTIEKWLDVTDARAYHPERAFTGIVGYDAQKPRHFWWQG
jgi:hypothetical protein